MSDRSVGPDLEQMARDDADLRLWVLRVESWEVHIGAGHPTLGTGKDRRVAVDPRHAGSA